MKRIFNTIIFLLTVLLLVSCKDKVIREYYRVWYTPPRVTEDIFGQIKTTKPVFDIQELSRYATDSIAIAMETKRLNELYEYLPQSCEEEIKKMKSSTEDPKFQQMNEKIIREAYDDLLLANYFLLAFSHPEGYDKSEFLSKVKEYGIMSSKVQNYIKENQLDVSIIPLNTEVILSSIMSGLESDQ